MSNGFYISCRIFYFVVVYAEIRTPVLVVLTPEERQIRGAHIPDRLVRVLVHEYHEIVI